MKKVVSSSLICIIFLMLFLTACTKSESVKESVSPSGKAGETANGETKSQDFIADRKFNVKIYQPGIKFPPEQINNMVANNVRSVTGMTAVMEGMKSDNIIQELTLDLASGELPDAMAVYWEGTTNANSSAILALLAKAAKEDNFFYDMKPFMEETTSKWNRFLDPNYLTADMKENVVNRPEFDGHIYMTHVGLMRENVPSDVWIGATQLYMRGDIAKALGVDLSTIRTQDDLYQLAKKINEGDFKDGNGKKVTAIGPTIWGGSNQSAYYPNYNFGNQSNFDKDKDGKVKHVIMTDYPLQSVEFIRKLMAEGLMDKESFSMPGNKATEAFANASYGMMIMHAFSQTWDGGSDLLRAKNKDKLYLPVGPMNNYTGTNEKAVVRRGNMLFLIPKSTKNPDEILKFMGWSTSTAGKLVLAGIEGEHYEFADRKSQEYLKYTKPDADDNGKDIVLTSKFKDEVSKDPKLMDTLGLTQGFLHGAELDTYTDLAAYLGLQDPDQEKYDYGRKMLSLAAANAKVVDGLTVNGLLQKFEGNKVLSPVLDAYSDTFTKAAFAKSTEEAKGILDAYKKQLMDAGLDNALQYLQAIEDKKPGSILYFNTN